MFTIRFNKTLAAVAFCALAFSAVPSFAEDAKLPQTAAEHEARAKSYKEQAANYKKAAEEHKQMAAEYANAHPDFKGGVKNPFNEKMAKHCDALAKEFEQLATDTEKAADFHAMRAKELQGK
jgi:hypothetical protein